MWIVAIGWIYVIGLVAVSETSIVAGVMTFLGYCVLPLSILFYLTGGKRRRAARERAAIERSGTDNGIGASSVVAGGAVATGPVITAADSAQCSPGANNDSPSSSCDSGGSSSSSSN